MSARLRRGFLARPLSRVTTVAIVAGILAVVGLGAWRLAHREPPDTALASGEQTLPRGTRSVTLFFASAAGDTLVAEERQVLEPERVTDTVRALIEELVRGPSVIGARALFPRGVSVRHVFFDESGNVFVDFSSDLRRFRGGSTPEYLLLASLVRTLSSNLPTITSVTLTLDGKPVPTLAGHFSLEGPLAVSDWR